MMIPKHSIDAHTLGCAASRCLSVTSPKLPCANPRRGTATANRRILMPFAVFNLVVLAFAAQPLFAQGTNYEGPVGVTGIFNGNVSTACSYDPLTHSAHRAIDDIIVPGSIGKYPLKMTRYYNSRQQYYATAGAIGLSPGWAHEYSWLLWTSGAKVVSPHGSVNDDTCGPPVGVSEGWEGSHSDAAGTWRLADGGKVVFFGGHVTDIYDPYGQRTRIAYNTSGTQIWERVKVTEPGGRCLWFIYGTQNQGTGWGDGTWLLTRVEAYDSDGSPGSPTHPNGNLIDWVNYTYQVIDPINPPITQRKQMMLTGVVYRDSTSATYTYTTDNVPESGTSHKMYPLVQRCDDVRYNGPMRTIFYDYQNGGPHGAITDETYPGVGAVSAIAPGAGVGDTFTETRGDGPARSFTYTHMMHCQGNECGQCDDYENNDPPQQMLDHYTDFQTHTTYLGYDANWYVSSVQDVNGHTTYYTRGPPLPSGIGQITQIKHPDLTHIDYVYELEPSPTPGVQAIQGHYVQSVTDERGTYVGDPAHTTTYARDGNHRVTRIDYPSDASTPASYEEFTYNGFGQILTHHLRNDAWESFAYDGRGLLTDRYNPKQGGVPSGSDPHTHYSYYTSGPWTDRVQTMTLPPNYPYNLQASETYEYDRALGADGTTNPTGAAVSGRGLVTKITHADNTYQSFGYDAYGNKRSEENELRQRTTYTYDDYNRVLSVKDPIGQTTGHTTNYTYTPTNGGGGSSYKHTTSNPDTVTTPSGIVTSNVYDVNFRKTSSGVAGLTTWLGYDNVGNQTYLTDPRGTSTPGSYTTYTDYDSRNRKWQVRAPLGYTSQFLYEDGINITKIIRAFGTPDSNTETKTYDAMNRVLSDTVPQTASISLTTNFTYNPSGTIWRVSDPKGNVTSFQYDASDRKTTMTYPSTGGPSADIQQWGYDDAGNLKFRITVNHEEQDFYYDNRNRNNGTWWSNWNNNIVDWRYFGHDAASRLIEAENGTGGWGKNVISDVHRSYDAAGHITQEEQNLYGVYPVYVNYPSYDDDGRLTRMNVSGVSTYDFTYFYDAMGRFEQIFITNGAQLFQYYYDAASNETERHNVTANGVKQVYLRDALNRIQNMDVVKGTTTLAHEGYTYDAMNRITLVSYQSPQPSDSFQYYLDGELKTANLGNLGHNLTYNLDKKGNRTTVVDNNVTSTYVPNTIDQYTTGAGTAVVNGLEHEIQTYGGVTYGYISDERLSSAAAGGTTYSMVYDALGRCMKRSITGGPTTYYLYDGEKPILEYDANTGASVGTNLYGKGVDEILERVAIGSNGQTYVYFPQQNHEGSVTLLTDPSGIVLERYRYDAFGAPTIYAPLWTPVRSATIYDNRFLFTGREYAATYRSTYTNTAFKFYEYRARAYNPILGRFMSEDPKLFDAGDYNLFRYCHNDPIDFTDPMGLAFIDQGEVPSPIIGGQSAGMYGYTQHQLQLVGATLTRADGGFQLHVKDFNYITKSYITHRADYYRNNQRIVFDREQSNIERTSKHEADHRGKEHQEYDRVRDQVLKDLNSGQIYKDQKAAERALSEKLNDAFRDFNHRDHNHLEPVWHNFKAAPLERRPDVSAQKKLGEIEHSQNIKPD